MGDRNVSTEALDTVIKALDKYIEEINATRKKMKDAAIDCHDNMGKDVLSKKAIGKMDQCVAALNTTVTKASELRNRIVKKKKQIEELGQ